MCKKILSTFFFAILNKIYIYIHSYIFSFLAVSEPSEKICMFFINGTLTIPSVRFAVITVMQHQFIFILT